MIVASQCADASQLAIMHATAMHATAMHATADVIPRAAELILVTAGCATEF